MTDPRTAGSDEDDEREVIYHSVCPWSVSCRQCLIKVHDGEEYVCPFDKRRRVRGSKQVTNYGTPYTLIQCCIVLDEEDDDAYDS